MVGFFSRFPLAPLGSFKESFKGSFNESFKSLRAPLRAPLRHPLRDPLRNPLKRNPLKPKATPGPGQVVYDGSGLLADIPTILRGFLREPWPF